MASPPGGSSFLLVAVNATLEDSSFKTGSEVAAQAHEAAETLRDWCEDKTNEVPYADFSRQLLRELEGALPSNVTLNRENIWRLFFKVRSSSTFNSLWRSFLQRVGVPPTPILYQHLTDLIFKMLIRNRFNYTSSSGCAASVTQETSINEGYALRYAAGYVVRHVLKKIRASNQPCKDELIKCCQRLVKMQWSDDAENTAEEWTDLVDRGGLYHVKETTFQLFVALEDEVRKYLGQLSSPHAMRVKDQFISSLCGCEDVQFYWCIIAADFDIVDTDVHNHLLKMIIDLFVTIRGFSYASEWMEHYKQAHKKCTQRSKSLRKRLYTAITD